MLLLVPAIVPDTVLSYGDEMRYQRRVQKTRRFYTLEFIYRLELSLEMKFTPLSAFVAVLVVLVEGERKSAGHVAQPKPVSVFVVNP